MNIARRWFNRIRSIYPSPLDQANALALLWINLALVAIWPLVVVLHLWPRIVAEPDTRFILLLLAAGIPAAVFTIHRLILSHSLPWAERLAVLGLLIVTVSPIAALQPGQTAPFVLLLLPVVAAGIMRPRRELALLTVVVSLSAVLSLLGRSLVEEIQPGPQTFNALATVLLSIWVTAALVGLFKGLERTVVNSALRATERAKLLNDLGDRLSAAPDENAVLVAVADTMTDKLKYAACQVYLFDSQGRLNRHARTGMGTHHTVTAAPFEGEQESAVGQALHTRASVVVSASEPLARRSHLLPSSRFGAAVPLLLGEHALGALDIQTNETGSAPFEGLDLALLEVAARMTAAALARQRETALLRRTLDEQESIAGGLRAQIETLRQHAQQTGGDWSSYVQGRSQGAFGFDLRRENMAITPASDLPDTLRPALARGEPVVLTQGNIQVVNVPIRLRDEILGAMSFSLPPGRQASDRQMDTVRAVAERLALALENARLVEQSQAQVTRERRAGDISNLLIGQQDVSAVLQLAAERFNEALGAVYTHIYLEPATIAAQDEEAAR